MKTLIRILDLLDLWLEYFLFFSTDDKKNLHLNFAKLLFILCLKKHKLSVFISLEHLLRIYFAWKGQFFCFFCFTFMSKTNLDLLYVNMLISVEHGTFFKC